MIISQRPLKPEEIETLIQEIHRTPHITFIGGNAWEQFPLVYVAQRRRQFIGCCAVIPLGNWMKIGPFLIRNTHQGQGYGKQLLTAVINKNITRRLFIATSNPAVRHMVETLGFTQISLSATPPEVKRYLAHFVLTNLSMPLLTAFLRKTLFGKRGKPYCFVWKG